MEWRAEIIHPKPLKFVIVKEWFTNIIASEPGQYGYYFYVYENGRNTYDYLQDTLEIAMEQAFEQFAVPYEAWRKVK